MQIFAMKKVKIYKKIKNIEGFGMGLAYING